MDSSTTITYDAFGRVVETSVSGVNSEIEYSPVGKVAVMNGSTEKQAYVPLPGGEVLSPSPDTFWHRDWLGTVRLASSASSRTVTFDRAFAPFGEMYKTVTGGASNPNFTGDTQDTIAGEFDTPYRELHPGQGRWISPDPAGLAAAAPANPQSWNRYVYVANNPLNAFDPLGLCIVDGVEYQDDDFPCGGGGVGGGGGGGYGGVPIYGYCPDEEGGYDCVIGIAYPPAQAGPGGKGGGGGGGPANNGQPPLLNTRPADQIAAELAAYNQCVMSSSFNVFEPDKLEVPEAPEGRKADMGISPNEGTVPVPSNNDLFISTMKSCLMQHPLAALSPAYPGLSPGSVF